MLFPSGNRCHRLRSGARPIRRARLAAVTRTRRSPVQAHGPGHGGASEGVASLSSVLTVLKWDIGSAGGTKEREQTPEVRRPTAGGAGLGVRSGGWLGTLRRCCGPLLNSAKAWPRFRSVSCSSRPQPLLPPHLLRNPAVGADAENECVFENITRSSRGSHINRVQLKAERCETQR